MSLRLAARRLALSAGSSSPLTSSTSTGSTTLLNGSISSSIQRRHKWSDRLWGSGGKKSTSADASDAASDLDDPKKRRQFMEQKMMDNTNGGIFADEIEAANQSQGADDGSSALQPVSKTRDRIAMVVDPDPRSRVRWERKKVIQMVRKNGKVTREERLRMTERELLHKSEFLPTSVKKLVMLARQIAGKPIDEAITQMRWSKKKMAAEVRYYLEEARDLAIAQRGMGLGATNGELLEKARKIKTRDGKWLEINDPTRIYIAQSWTGRGPWAGKQLEYKGRGHTGIIKHPATSFTVILKEEKTRVREYEEREARKSNQGPWVHLPNRKVYGQRPYYLW